MIANFFQSLTDRGVDYLLISGSIKEDLRRMLAIVEAEKMRSARVHAPEF